MGTATELAKLKDALKTKEEKRVPFDYYRGKMAGIEKTHKETEDPKKRARWVSNIAKQTEANKEYHKACNEVKDLLTLLEERAKVTCD